MGISGALVWLGYEMGLWETNWVSCVVLTVTLDRSEVCSVLGIYTHATVILERWEGLVLVPGTSPVLKVGTWAEKPTRDGRAEGWLSPNLKFYL